MASAINAQQVLEDLLECKGGLIANSIGIRHDDKGEPVIEVELIISENAEKKKNANRPVWLSRYNLTREQEDLVKMECPDFYQAAVNQIDDGYGCDKTNETLRHKYALPAQALISFSMGVHFAALKRSDKR